MLEATISNALVKWPRTSSPLIELQLPTVPDQLTQNRGVSNTLMRAIFGTGTKARSVRADVIVKG